MAGLLILSRRVSQHKVKEDQLVRPVIPQIPSNYKAQFFG